MSVELPREDLTRDEVVREIARLAALDYRRGIHYWFDGELTDALREVALGGGSSAVPRPAARRIAPPLGSPDAASVKVPPAAIAEPRSGASVRDLQSAEPAAPPHQAPPSTPPQVTSLPHQAPPSTPPQVTPLPRPAPPSTPPQVTSLPHQAPPSTPPQDTSSLQPAPPSTPGSRPAAPAQSPEHASLVPPRQTELRSSKGPTAQPAPQSEASRIPNWGTPPLASGRGADWADRLAGLGAKAAGCELCDLCQTRNKVVFGVGSAAVPLVFVGEAPGADEDREGYPFVGRAGQLLDKIIRAIGLERDEIYICNVLKCRPPGNRNPEPNEIAKCTPFLEEQLAILNPKVICTLGLFASQYLLQSQLPIGKLRGRLFDYRGTPVVPTYHPAALLRNSSLKPAVWEDVQLVRRTLDS